MFLNLSVLGLEAAMLFLSELESLYRKSHLKGDPKAIYQVLLDCYTEPHRYYHGMEHIGDGLHLWSDFKNSLTAGDIPYGVDLAVRWAWLFHDAIYRVDPDGYPLNEERSAGLAVKALGDEGMSPDMTGAIQRLILVTKHLETPPSLVASALADIDLAGLGYPIPAFDRNNRFIRLEFADIPDQEFWPKHLEVLRAFRDRPKLYYTSYFHGRFDRQARLNLHRRISQLQRQYG